MSINRSPINSQHTRGIMSIITILILCISNAFSADFVSLKNHDLNHHQVSSNIEQLDPLLVDLLISEQHRHIKRLVFSLLNPTAPANPKKKMLFIGKPGVGKTQLAQAIAIKTKSLCKLISTANIGNEYQNSASEMLLKETRPFFEIQQPCILIVDEIAKLYRRHSNNNSEDFNTNLALYEILHYCTINPNLIFIGTANDTKNIPDPLKSRFSNAIIQIPQPNAAFRTKIINFYLNDRHNLTPKYLNYLGKITTDLAGRELKEFVNDALDYAYEEGTQTVEARHCDLVIKEMNLNSWSRYFKFLVLTEDQQKSLYSFFQVTQSYVSLALQIYGLIQSRQLYFDQKSTTEQHQLNQATLSRELHNDQKSLTRELNDAQQKFTERLHEDQKKFAIYSQNRQTMHQSLLNRGQRAYWDKNGDIHFKPDND